MKGSTFNTKSGLYNKKVGHLVKAVLGFKIFFVCLFSFFELNSYSDCNPSDKKNIALNIIILLLLSHISIKMVSD